MSEELAAILAKHHNDPTRLVDMLHDLQLLEGQISEAAIEQIGQETGLARTDIEQTVSFYHFFSQAPRGKYTVYLNNSAVAEMMGCAEVAAAFEQAAGCSFGSVTADGQIGLFYTADIGMNDQEVAALINGTVFTCLTADKAAALVGLMRQNVPVEAMMTEYGDGKNAHIRTMVKNNIRKTGPVCFGPYQPGAAVRKCAVMLQQDIVSEVKTSKLRGRGGAGFSTGMKWEICAKAKTEGSRRCVIANADDGEASIYNNSEKLFALQSVELRTQTARRYKVFHIATLHRETARI